VAAGVGAACDVAGTAVCGDDGDDEGGCAVTAGDAPAPVVAGAGVAASAVGFGLLVPGPSSFGASFGAIVTCTRSVPGAVVASTCSSTRL
jgi:hypothetical protein